MIFSGKDYAMSNQVQQFQEDSFDQLVLASDRPVLVDFYADWCAPCRAVGPTIEALADEYAGRITVGKVDIDANGPLAGRFEIQSIPTLLLFVGGRIVKRFAGVQTREALAGAIDEALAQAAA
jgi:thioredoxin